MSYEPVKVGNLKVGKFVIDPKSNETCKIISIEKSKPGKHGAAKARITMVGIFDKQKRELLQPVDKRINVPLIDKRDAQVITIGSDSYSVMDNQTYETFEMAPPEEEEIKKKVEIGFNEGKTIHVDYWIVMDRKKIVAMKQVE
ncbi:MAG: translation initiation factor IF-5A [Candidatus Hodarchaeales archaeon]|jgi:translation initiation factor 5A